jgi:hypothetical protein
MKGLSLGALLVMVACYLAALAGCYFQGALRPIGYILNDPFITGPILLGAFLVLIATWLFAIIRRRNGWWALGTFIGFAAFVAADSLAPPDCMIIFGIRDHVMQVATLADLRRFAQSVDGNQFEVWKGGLSAMSQEKQDAYRSLQRDYPFLNWGLGGGGSDVSVSDVDGVVKVEWGGALDGHWGFCISVDGGKKEPEPRPYFTVLPMSRDICFFTEED